MPDDFYDGEEPQDGDETPDDKDLTEQIDEWLTDARPERYDKSDMEWMDAIIEKAEAELADRPTEEVLHDAARRRVRAREGEAVKRANKILRDIARTGQLPLWWLDGDNWQIIYRHYLRLPFSIGQHRVRFGAMTEGDWEEWVAEFDRDRDRQFTSRQETLNGAALLIQWLIDQHVIRTEDLRPSDN